MEGIVTNIALRTCLLASFLIPYWCRDRSRFRRFCAECDIDLTAIWVMEMTATAEPQTELLRLARGDRGVLQALPGVPRTFLQDFARPAWTSSVVNLV